MKEGPSHIHGTFKIQVEKNMEEIKSLECKQIKRFYELN
jgi:hypothetical protein